MAGPHDTRIIVTEGEAESDETMKLLTMREAALLGYPPEFVHK